jgi:hypothetical protein
MRKVLLFAALLAFHGSAQAQKVSALPAATTPLAGTELVPCVQASVTSKCTAANVAQSVALSGDVATSTGSSVATIQPAAVTLAKQANLAANSIIGNNTGAPATPLALTTAQTKTLLAIANTDVSGLGTFATANAATPPGIGGTTPAAGAFTTLSASSTVSGTGFSTYLASPPAIGGTAPAGGAFTSLTSTTPAANLASGLTQAANTSVDGLTLIDSTTAAAAAQQFSPRLRLTGQGWKTNATAASQPVDWIIETQPVQGAANPTSNLVMSFQVNGGGYTAQMTMGSGTTGALSFGGTSTASFNGPVLATALRVSGATVPGNGLYLPAANSVGIATNTLAAASFDANQNFIPLKGIFSGGTTFTLGTGTGACATTSTLTGGAIAGSFLCTGTAGASTQPITLPTAAHGWACVASDVTSGVAWAQSATSATGCTIKGAIATTSDVVVFSAMGY